MKFLPFDQDRFNRDAAQRIKQLERDAGRNERPGRTETAYFSQSGALALTASDDAPEWDVDEGGQIVRVVARLKVAGSSSSVFTIYLNGASIGTITLTSSTTRASAYLGNYRARDGDSLSVRCTTAGTGAKSASIKIRMKG